MVFIVYLNCGAWFKFKGLGLPILQVHLQNVWQEEEGVPLQTKQWSEGRVALRCQYTTLYSVYNAFFSLSFGCDKWYILLESLSWSSAHFMCRVSFVIMFVFLYFMIVSENSLYCQFFLWASPSRSSFHNRFFTMWLNTWHLFHSKHCRLLSENLCMSNFCPF